MALALRISAHHFTSKWQPVGLGFIFPRYSCRVNWRCAPIRRIRCSRVDAEETAEQVGAKDSNVAGSHSPSWGHVEPDKDSYAGWALEDHTPSEYVPGRRAGFLRIGAAIALSVAFALVTYTAYSRKGTKHAAVFPVSTEKLQQKGLPSDEPEGADRPLTSDSSSAPSSTESKQGVSGEYPELDVASVSDLHQKKTVSGQDSISSKDVTDFSDEKNDFQTDFLADSDLESSEDYDATESEKVDNNAASTAEDQVQPINDSLTTPYEVSQNDELSKDEKSIVVSGDTVNPDLGGAGLSPDRSDFDESPSESTSQINVLELGKEQSDDASLGDARSTESIKGPEESNSVVAKPDANPSTESNEETMLTVSASLVVPKGTAEDVLEIVGLDTPFKVDASDLTAPEPGHVNKSPSVIETHLSSVLGSEFWHSESVESVDIRAPSTPSAAAQATPGSIVIPAKVDHEQEQTVAALQALKVIEPGIEAGGICTRREYARWLVAVTGTLARSPAHKVFPAMYIDAVSELAFNDVVPEDPDFPYIQGLAEAGLISSNLSGHDADENGRSTDGAIFLPDSPLSRQDLVSWKIALEGHNPGTVDKKKLKDQTGFIDFDRIKEDALPFFALDLAAGEQSIISTAFGYTRRFQPDKPVTRAQAAMALVTGEAADVVAEELTRLEADDIAEAAVVAELARESRAQKQVDEYFNTELKLEKDFRLSVEKQFEEVKHEFERVMKEREDERVSLLSLQAAVQAEKDLLHRFRQDMEEQLQTLTAYKVEVGIEKNRLESLRKEAEDGGQALSSMKVEVEVEKKALILARLWAEDEAKKARAHGKILEEARKRWEGHGIQVKVDKDLDDDNVPALGWKYAGQNSNLSRFLQRPPVQDILDKAGDLKSRVVRRFLQILEELRRAFTAMRLKAAESFQVVQEKACGSLRVVSRKAQVLQQDTFSVASKKAQEAQYATRSTVAGFSSVASKKAQEAQDATRSSIAGFSSAASKKAQEAQEATQSTVASFSSVASKKAQEAQEATRSTVAGFSSVASKKAQEAHEATRATVAGFSSVASKKVQEAQDTTQSSGGLSSFASKMAQQAQDATQSSVGDLSSVVSKKAQEAQDATRSTVDDLSSVASKKVQEAQEATQSTVAGFSSVVSKKAQEAKDITGSTVAGLSSSVAEGTRKVADGLRGEAQKLVGKFKS